MKPTAPTGEHERPFSVIFVFLAVSMTNAVASDLTRFYWPVFAIDIGRLLARSACAGMLVVCSKPLTDPRPGVKLVPSWLGNSGMRLGQLKRRGFITLLGSAAAWPLAARAQRQTAKLPTIGYLGPTSAENKGRNTVAFFVASARAWLERGPHRRN